MNMPDMRCSEISKWEGEVGFMEQKRLKIIWKQLDQGLIKIDLKYDNNNICINPTIIG